MAENSNKETDYLVFTFVFPEHLIAKDRKASSTIMSHLSIILPLSSTLDAFEDTLASVLRHQPMESEIFVIHDGTYDDPHDLELEGVRFVERKSNESETDAVLRIADESGNEFVHILGSGTEVEEGWCEHALDFFEDTSVFSVSPVMVFENEPSRVATLGIGYSSVYRPLLVGHRQSQQSASKNVRRVAGPSRWGGFYRASLLTAIRESEWELIDEIFDLQLALCIEKLGYENRVAADSFIHLSDTIDLSGELKSISGASLFETLCQFSHSNRNNGFLGKLRSSVVDCVSTGLSPSVILNSFSRFGVRGSKVADDFRIAWDRLCWQVRDSNEEVSGNESVRRAA